MTYQAIADTLGITRQLASRYVKGRGCPRTTPEAVLAWYGSNIRMKSDRQRPATAGGALRGPAPTSRILEVIDNHDGAFELEEDLRGLPGQIASQPDFLCTIQNNQAVRRCVGALRDKWYGAR
jgi:hypothetical protein